MRQFAPRLIYYNSSRAEIRAHGAEADGRGAAEAADCVFGAVWIVGFVEMLTRLRMTKLFAEGCLVVACLAPISFAQGPIRVETDQVVVPTVVFDKKLYAHQQDLQSRIEKDPHFWDTIAIRDLVASDFHLSEDGRDQTIVSVKLEAPTSVRVEDNRGRHTEKV